MLGTYFAYSTVACHDALQLVVCMVSLLLVATLTRLEDASRVASC